MVEHLLKSIKSEVKELNDSFGPLSGAEKEIIQCLLLNGPQKTYQIGKFCSRKASSIDEDVRELRSQDLVEFDDEDNVCLKSSDFDSWRDIASAATEYIESLGYEDEVTEAEVLEKIAAMHHGYL